MLKDYNSKQSIFSEFSRKGAKKGSKDLSLLYAFDPEVMEPIATKPYVGNMLDMTSIDDFVEDYNIRSGLMVFDKGFPSKALLDKLAKAKGLSYIAPLKTNSKLIKRYKMDEPDIPLEGYEDGMILCKKVKMSNGKFLYSFRDPKAAMEQEVGYIAKAKKKLLPHGQESGAERRRSAVVDQLLVIREFLPVPAQGRSPGSGIIRPRGLPGFRQ